MRCYMDYCLLLHEEKMVPETNSEAPTYSSLIIEKRNDKNIWDKIFDRNHITYKYYTKLCEYHINTEEPKEKPNYTSQKQANVYSQKTFQEFIDSHVNLRTVGSYNYQEFIKNMKDENFKKNMGKKYENYLTEIFIKNHIVYVVQLQLYDKMGVSKYHTSEEREELDNSLNLIPYFEYLSANNWITIEDIKYDTMKDSVNMTDSYIRILESETLRLIHKFISE